jgi:hypothetical protein
MEVCCQFCEKTPIFKLKWDEKSLFSLGSGQSALA